MSSRGAALLGEQTPRVEHVPEFVWSDADDAIFLSSSYGLVPDKWQCRILDAWLGRQQDGKWAADQCGVCVARQNGKNGVVEVRELFGMVELGEKFLHTAHEVKTARKAFKRLQHFFGESANDPGAKFPELNALVKEVRSTNGQEAIVLHNGGSIEFVARSRGSGRGFTVDVLVCDEAQELTDEQLEALLSTISAAPLGNPQTIFMGTPPQPGQGEVFNRVRDAGVAGKNNRQSWHEWSVEGNVDIYDRKLWAKTNPALGGRLQESVIENELTLLTAEGFARERLGKWFAPGEATGPFPVGKWAAGIDPASVIPVDAPLMFCLTVSIDRTRSHIGVAGLRSDGVPHIELIASSVGTDWPIEWFTERAAKKPMSVVVQARGAPASPLIPDLEAIEGLTVVEWGGPDLGNATAKLFDAVKASTLVEQPGGLPIRKGVAHLPQPLLDVAAATAVPKILTDGGMAWDGRKSPTDIGPLAAVTGALWGLGSAKPEPESAYETGRFSMV